MTIDFRGKKLKYKLLNLIEFNSTRKRMSIVVETPDGKIKCLCKGADSIIQPLLDNKNQVNLDLWQKTNEFLELYATDGLRTLLIAEKEIDRKVYDAWNKKF